MICEVEIGEHTYEHEQADGDGGANFHQAVGLPPERGALFRGFFQVLADFAILGLPADFIYQHGAAARKDERAGIAIVVFPVLAAIRGIRGFPDAFGLAGEGGFIDAEIVGAQNKAVRRDFYALFYEQKIPGDEILAGDLLFPAISEDFGMRGGELF